MKRLLSLILAVLMLASFVPAMAENIIVYPIADDPEQMDPTLNSYSRSSIVLQQMFRGLYKVAPDGKSYVPCLASGYELSEDQLTYTFKLKEGLKYSDGSPITAQDFEYSWKRVMDPAVASRACSDMWVIKNARAFSKGECTADEVGVKALDDLTLEVTMEHLTPWFISMTAITSYLAVKPEVFESAEPWTKSVDTYVCSGPFMPVEFAPLARIKMVKNPNYVDADQVQVDGVNIVIIPDQATELTAYNNGDVNVSDNLSPDAVTQYQNTDQFFSVGKIGIQYADFNCAKPEFADKRVRQAFSKAIDRKALLSALRLVEKPVYGFIPHSQPSLTQEGKSYREVAGDMFTEDVAAAQALMAEAGYPGGAGFPEVEIVTKSDNEQKLYAQILGEMWKAALGVSYRITTYESATYWDELANGNFSVDRNGYTCDYVDPVANITIFVTGSNASENAWDDPVYDEMVLKINELSDPADREAAIIEAEKYLVDQMPAMPVYSYEDSFLVKPEIKGIVKNPVGHIDFEYATFQ